ncbi:MAG TPA: sulfite exporter TauE/SafE family protein [Verrucomicrobiae bacterium]|nr:sulfite exporter TauE/SafE family protein [Verrucomicrobiae bacterium]
MNFFAAIFLGLVGSLHCAGMCGPLALALPATGRTRLGFLSGRLAYNLGRIITYCLLGVIFGLLGRTLVLAGIQRWVSIALGVLLIIGLFSSRKLAVWRPVIILVEKLKFRMTNLLRRRSFVSLLSLGVLNGFLPCGLVYVACAGAVATGGLVSGVEYMAGFGLGTVPLMLGIGLSGHLFPMALRLQLRKAIPVSVFLLASLLILRGLGLGIPYVSPNLAGGSSCCNR